MPGRFRHIIAAGLETKLYEAYGRKQGVAVTLNASRGKGSHQTLYFGSVFTIVRNPKDELKTGTFHGMCSQLGVKPNDL
jgi:mRNA interferase HicA